MQDTTQPQPAPGGPTVDAHAIDYGLIWLLCTHAMMTQIVYAMVRVTISYRTIELGLEPIWVGIITGAVLTFITMAEAVGGMPSTPATTRS